MWRTTQFEGTVEEWYPAVNLGTSGLALGVSRGGIWLVGDNSECVRVNSSSAGVRLLPLLEGNAEATKEAIGEAVESCHVPLAESLDLPVHVALKAALAGSVAVLG